MFIARSHAVLAALVCLGTLAPAASALTPVTVFDFEDQAATFTTPPDVARAGALTSLALVKDGLTLSLAREGNNGFDIVSNTGTQINKPAGWGARSLDPFFAENTTDAFVGTFSAPVNAVSVEFGDYGSDGDVFVIEGYDGPNGTGTLLGTNTVPYGASAFPTFGTGSLSAPGVRSIRFYGGSAEFPQSLFYDNISIDGNGAAVPEAGSMSLLVGVLPLLGFLRRRIR